MNTQLGYLPTSSQLQCMLYGFMRNIKSNNPIYILPSFCYRFFFLSIYFFHLAFFANSQNTSNRNFNYVQEKDNSVFGTDKSFIENIGQYGEYNADHPEMGEILFGYEGLEAPIQFTKKGLIHLQKKTEQPSEEERERLEKKGLNEDEIMFFSKNTERVITAEWLNCNPNVSIVSEDLSSAYHTYGSYTEKARSFKRITYKELYPGIDVIYSFDDEKTSGFEYSLIVRPNADLSIVKLKYNGEIKSIRRRKNGMLVIKSDIQSITETCPVSYYDNDRNSIIQSTFSVNDRIVSFAFPSGYDKSRTIIIDPFISAAAGLTGTNVSKAKDVDYDYAGNVYVAGGGDGNVHKLSKFDPTGTLLWTFTGTVATPAWSFGPYYGGWVVEKSSGSIYLGQGFNPSTGYIVIRLNTAGTYDNYASTGNTTANENWKMFWTCNNGTPQILIAGGGTSGNLNLGVLTPPSTVISGINLTALTGACCQDVADMAVDPATLDVYPIYASLGGTPFVNNRLYKNAPPYNSAFSWTTLSGYTALSEANNRPYMSGIGGSFNDNAANILALNSSYLFYWDGKNLKAFNKASGNAVGTALTLAANTTLMQGGIEVDECNTIFIGSINGTIKVYHFDGNIFDDTPADIIVPGFGTKSIYDLVYNDSQKILYACGDGFVGSFDVSGYGCNANPFALSVASSCGTSTANASISPIPPVGSTVTYFLYLNTNQIASNTIGIFSGLSPNTNYTLKAIVNQACSGAETSTTFSLPGPTIVPTLTPALCGSNNGIISIAASGGIAPYTYSMDGLLFQPSNAFNGLPSGIYTVYVKDVNGCSNNISVNIQNSNGPGISFTKTDAICGNNTGVITATGSGGIAPLSYSIDGIAYQTNSVFVGVAPGNYVLTVKDATNCTNSIALSINNIPGATVNAFPNSTFCSTNNGSITVAASGGQAPLLFSINGNSFQSGNTFNSLAAGNYTVTVKDGNNCISASSVVIANLPPPTVTATATNASCANANGFISVFASGGLAPIQYSLNGTTFQTNSVFSGLTAGTYLITVKDANNCTNTTSVTLTSSGAPIVTATSTTSACNINNGTITASGSGGSGALQYSLNNITFQSSTLFSGLAANTYLIYVRDALGCLGANYVTVSNTAAPTLSVAITPTACNTSNGSIVVTGSGGTTPYQYSINNGISFQLSNTFTALGTGTYGIVIKDANGCTSSTTQTLNNVAGLSISASNISSSCSINSGSITATGTGGVGPLQYSINNATYQSSNIFSNLSGGNYTVYVKDANGCISSTTLTILISLSPSISATIINATCGGSNGVITASGSGGVAPLQYSINGTTYQSNNVFLNIAPGTYTVYVKDATNCVQTTSVTITNVGTGSGITTFTVVTKGTFACNGDLGKITNPRVNGSNCNSCTFSLNNGPFVSNQTQLFLNLSPGTYTVTAKDANGCTKTIQVTIGPGVIATATATATAAACNTTNGTITIVGVGANQPYHASINGIAGPWNTFFPPGANSFTFTGLAPGTYTITMADDADFVSAADPGSCFTTMQVVVPTTGGPSISATQTGGTCGQSNGTINANGSGGSGTLTYSIDGINFQNSGVFNGLAAGSYIVTVKDATGCTNATTINVLNPGLPIAAATTTSATCNTNNGIITASASSGVGPYQFSINGFNYQTSNVFNGLAPGTYTLWVQDSGPCISSTTISVSNIPKATVTALSIPSSCNNTNGTIIATGASGTLPYQYSINGVTFQSSNVFSNLAPGFYTITIKDANGCLNTTGVAVASTSTLQQTLSATPATCNGANGTITSIAASGTGPYQFALNGSAFQNSNNFSTLLEGSYSVQVKDASGCIATNTILVSSLNVPQSLTATTVNPNCGNNNGSIVASASGGVLPLQYSIDGTTFQSSPTFSPLAAGTYPLTVKDANQCTKVINVTITNLPGPNVNASTTPSSCFSGDGAVIASAAGGTGILTYSIDGATFQNDPVFTPMPPGAYTVTAKDINGCMTSVNTTINEVTGPSLVATASITGCGGNILALGTSGIPPYQYNINNSAFQNGNAFPCQPYGTYVVGLMDANGCIDTMTLVLASLLPIELISFSGESKEKFNYLEWSTSSERNNDFFTLEKSYDGLTYSYVSTVKGSGNSNEEMHYSTIDEHPFPGMNYYRLNQTDFNGHSEQFSTVIIENVLNASITYAFHPRSKELEVWCNECENELQHLELKDASGKSILSGNFNGQHCTINTSAVAQGVYILRVYSNFFTYTYKVMLY